MREYGMKYKYMHIWFIKNIIYGADLLITESYYKNDETIKKDI